MNEIEGPNARIIIRLPPEERFLLAKDPKYHLLRRTDLRRYTAG